MTFKLFLYVLGLTMCACAGWIAADCTPTSKAIVAVLLGEFGIFTLLLSVRYHEG